MGSKKGEKKAKSSKKEKVKKPLVDPRTEPSPFDPVPYETLMITTSITLLSSPEEEIVLRALSVLSKYANQKEINISFLNDNGILPKLLQVLQNSADVQAIKFSLKLIGEIITAIPNSINIFFKGEKFEEIEFLIALFIKDEDMIVKEFCAEILAILIKTSPIVLHAFESGIIKTIFALLNTSQDPDVQKNSLELLYTIVQTSEASELLHSSMGFEARVLPCYMKSKFPEITGLAVKILRVLSTWKHDEMQEILRRDGVELEMLKFVLNIEFKTLHNDVFFILNNCIKNDATAESLLRTQEFLMFSQYVKECPIRNEYQAALLLYTMTKSIKMRQRLFDFSIEDSILSLFRTKSGDVFVKVCEAVSNMTSHIFCCQKMLTVPVMERITRELYQDTKIVPVKEAGINTISNFLKRNKSTMQMVADCGALVIIVKMFSTNKSDMTLDGFLTVMDIVYMFAADYRFRSTIMEKAMYEYLLNLHLDNISDQIAYQISEKALCILNQYVNDSECRQHFIELDGSRRCLEMMPFAFIHPIFKNDLVFMEQLFMYRRIGMEFLKAGALPILKDLDQKTEGYIPQLGRLIDMMLGLYLPLKFFENGRLEVTDILRDRFYLVHGDWKEPFPFLEILEKQKLSTRVTIYMVDYSALYETKPDQQEDTAPPKRSESNTTTSTKNSADRSSGETLIEIDPNQINYGGISPDPYLPHYIEHLELQLYFNEKFSMCLAHQIKTVARFVYNQLSGLTDTNSINRKQYDFRLHIAALKTKLGTNMLPIGYLRCGFLCERALLFKAVADKLGIPASLAKGTQNIYWNEVPLVDEETVKSVKYLTYYVVDLKENIGNLMRVGTTEANQYCGLE